jgi:uncharacterized membrane protein
MENIFMKQVLSKDLYDIIIIAFLSVFVVISFFVQGLNIVIIHKILGIFYLILIPGYVLMAIILPEKGVLKPIERLGLSIGLSLPITSIVGLALHYTKYGISIGTLSFFLAILTLIMSVYAYIRILREI